MNPSSRADYFCHIAKDVLGPDNTMDHGFELLRDLFKADETHDAKLSAFRKFFVEQVGWLEADQRKAFMSTYLEAVIAISNDLKINEIHVKLAVQNLWSNPAVSVEALRVAVGFLIDIAEKIEAGNSRLDHGKAASHIADQQDHETTVTAKQAALTIDNHIADQQDHESTVTAKQAALTIDNHIADQQDHESTVTAKQAALTIDNQPDPESAVTAKQAALTTDTHIANQPAEIRKLDFRNFTQGWIGNAKKTIRKDSIAQGLQPFNAEVEAPEWFAEQTRRANPTVATGRSGTNPLTKLPTELKQIIFEHVPLRERQELDDIDKVSFIKRNLDLIRVTQHAAIHVGLDEANHIKTITVTEQLMAIQPSWRVLVQDKDLTLNTLNLETEFIISQLQGLQPQVCYMLENLHGIPYPEKICEITFLKVACIGGPILLKTNLLSHFPNLNRLTLYDCTDIPMHEFCSQGLHLLKPTLTYSNPILGLPGRDRQTQPMALAFSILHIWRDAGDKFQKANTDRLLAPISMVTDQLSLNKDFSKDLMSLLMAREPAPGSRKLDIQDVIQFLMTKEGERKNMEELSCILWSRLAAKSLDPHSNAAQIYKCKKCGMRQSGICFSKSQKKGGDGASLTCELCMAMTRNLCNLNLKAFEYELRDVQFGQECNLIPFIRSILEPYEFEIDRKHDFPKEMEQEEHIPGSMYFEYVCPYRLTNLPCTATDCKLFKDTKLCTDKDANISLPHTIISCPDIATDCQDGTSCPYGHDFAAKRTAMASVSRIEHHKATGE